MVMIDEWLGAEGPERKRRMWLGFAGFFGLVLVIAGSVYLPAQLPQGAGGADGALASRGVAKVDGFRSATFGMSEGAVRAAIASDFNIKPAALASSLKVVENKVERTRILVARVPDLFQGAGLTEIGYVFGYQSKALIQVNLLWGTPLSPKVTANDLSLVTANLMRYFAAEGFGRDDVRSNVRIGKGAVLVFQGSDAKGRMVQLVRRVEPAAAAKEGEKQPLRMTLRLAYIANPETPDTFKIAKGAF
tara:strand:- start:2815 stop:3555 length:741 start_codon:yes stop_codon:yes gene_type:complete